MTHQVPSPVRRHREFTMLDLLVEFAISAVLISLVLPELPQAYEAARHSVGLDGMFSHPVIANKSGNPKPIPAIRQQESLAVSRAISHDSQDHP